MENTVIALYDLAELCDFNKRFYDEAIWAYIVCGTKDKRGSTLGLI